jgi:nitrite reductase (NADH) small subunit
VIEHVVCHASELRPGEVRIVRLGRSREVGVFNVGGRFYALTNICPHQGAPLCLGPVTGTTATGAEHTGAPALEWVRDGEIVRCPWHRWEFDIATGRTVFPSRFCVKTYPVRVEPESNLVIVDV